MDKSAFKSKNSAKLFVAGIPTGVKREAIAEFFRQYGHFDLIWEINKTSKRPKTGMKRGHCILVCYNQHQASILAAIRNFKFLGRTLTVSEYMSGAELAAQNKSLNQCRLILKKVPSYYTEQDLQKEIAHRYGGVRTVFRFRHANPDKEELRSCKFSVFSVIMETKESATRLSNKGFIDLSDGSTVQIEQYAKQVARGRNPTTLNGQCHPLGMLKTAPPLTDSPNPKTPKENQKLQYNSNPSFDHHDIKPTSKNHARHTTADMGIDDKTYERYNLEFRIRVPGIRI